MPAGALNTHPATEGQLFDAIGGARLVSGRLNLRQGTIAATALKIDACTVRMNGSNVAVAAAEPAFTATTHDIADPDANGREAIYLVLLARNGTVTIVKGTDAALGAALEPTSSADTMCIGRVKIAHNGTAIFDATTDSLSAAHLTVTYEDRVLPLAYASA